MKSWSASARFLVWPPFPLWRVGSFWQRTHLANQHGFSMVEIVVSIAVLSTTYVALVSAMATGYLGYRVVERDVTAGRLAVHQMENTKSYTPYLPPGGSYPTITPPAGYVLTVVASEVVDDLATVSMDEARDPSALERITVTVTYDGSPVKVLEDFKANR